MTDLTLNSITAKSLGELTDEDKQWLVDHQEDLSIEQKEFYKFVLDTEEPSDENNEDNNSE